MFLLKKEALSGLLEERFYGHYVFSAAKWILKDIDTVITCL
jgi:hypothetical protein